MKTKAIIAVVLCGLLTASAQLRAEAPATDVACAGSDTKESGAESNDSQDAVWFATKRARNAATPGAKNLICEACPSGEQTYGTPELTGCDNGEVTKSDGGKIPSPPTGPDGHAAIAACKYACEDFNRIHGTKWNCDTQCADGDWNGETYWALVSVKVTCTGKQQCVRPVTQQQE